MMRENIEDYLGAIYRLRKDAQTPVPLWPTIPIMGSR